MTQNLEGKVGEVIGRGMSYNLIEDLAKKYSATPTDPKIIESYVMNTRRGMDEDSLKMLIAEYKKAGPASVLENMNLTLNDAKDGLVKAVEPVYQNLVTNSPENYLAEMAMAVSGKAQMKEKVEKALKAGDLGTVRKAYSETFKDKAWKHFIGAIASDTFINAFSQKYFQYDANNFLSQFAAQREVDGEVETYLDSKSLSNYLLNAIKSAKDDKQRQAIYLEAGKAMAKAQEKLMAQQKAQEEAAAKAKKAAA
jgi:hypothetical protein